MPAPPARLILGTAGHIDHGKTALVRALSGVDTDRLAEEKRRGITIELGFAQYSPAEGCSFGIVDVPGHEGFVRTMVAGVTGIDVVMLVVAADEGVMPQTREHLAIVQLLGVERMVIAVTKTDLVDEEWLELVAEDVLDLVAGTPYESAETVPVTVRDPATLAPLAEALARAGASARQRVADDLFRLPVDRVFAVEGAGTVATGTLWSGSVARGDGVRILPGGGSARVRAVQVHGAQVRRALAGQRTALALTGASIRRGLVARGDVLVSDPSWRSSMMLTVEIAVLAAAGWRLEAGQRVRVHLGTVEVMARLALFGADEVPPGDPVPAQLRLEKPVVARTGDRFVIRSYSPATTIAGGVVLEPSPPKRKRLSGSERRALRDLARGPQGALLGAAALAGWAGLDEGEAGVLAGRRPGSARLPAGLRRIEGALFAESVAAEGERRILAAVRAHHESRSLEPGAPLDRVRASLPGGARAKLADGLAAGLAAQGRLEVAGRVARLPGFAPAMSAAEEAAAREIARALDEAELQGPSTAELLERVPGDPDRARAVLAFMAAQGRARYVGDSFWVADHVLRSAGARMVELLGGRAGLGPADFREVLPVTRKHLIPLLSYFDGAEITDRREDGRRVASAGGRAGQLQGEVPDAVQPEGPPGGSH